MPPISRCPGRTCGLSRPAALPRPARPPRRHRHRHRPRRGHAGTTRYACSPGECFFPCSQQDPRQVPSLQLRSTLRLFDQDMDEHSHESARLTALQALQMTRPAVTKDRRRGRVPLQSALSDDDPLTCLPIRSQQGLTAASATPWASWACASRVVVTARDRPAGACQTCELQQAIDGGAAGLPAPRRLEGPPRGSCGECRCRIFLTGPALEDCLCKPCRTELTELGGRTPEVTPVVAHPERTAPGRSTGRSSPRGRRARTWCHEPHEHRGWLELVWRVNTAGGPMSWGESWGFHAG